MTVGDHGTCRAALSGCQAGAVRLSGELLSELSELSDLCRISVGNNCRAVGPGLKAGCVGHAPSRRPDLLSAQPGTPGRDTRLGNVHGRSASPPRRAAELQLKPRAGGGKVLKAVCSAPARRSGCRRVTGSLRRQVTRPDELACSAGSGERAGDAVRDDRARGAAGAERAEKGADSASRGGRDATGARRVASAA